MKQYNVGNMPYKGLRDRILKTLGFRKMPRYCWFTGPYLGYKWVFMPQVKLK